MTHTTSLKGFKNNHGNIVIIATGIIAFFLMAITGAAHIIIDSLQTSSKIGAANRAYYAAEAGIETALFEKAGHGTGWEVNGSSVDLTALNRSQSTWDVAGLDEWERAQNTVGLDTLYIPLQKNTDQINALENWVEIDFGLHLPLPLYSDNSISRCETPLGNSSPTIDCIGYSTPNFSSNYGVDAANTTTLLGENLTDGAPAENNQLINVFVELFLPVEDVVGDNNIVLLSWQVSGQTHPDERTSYGFSDTMSLQARDQCDGDEIGAICIGHFKSAGGISHGDIERTEVDGGVIVRLNNPTGIIRAQTNTNYFYPIKLLDFFSRNFTYSDANITEMVSGYSLYFPVLILQTGSLQQGVRDGNIVYLPKAYARVGFRNATADFSNFPISDGTTVVTATAESNAAQQVIQIETSPKSNAPFFNFAVFQQ